ncbi:MAG: hypothetical protein JXA67_09720 [Micromonosporaceae bacterium]|nr:hypothetical protein [Micromonosporaceae bacterium]
MAEWVQPAAETGRAGVSEGLARRLKALACTAPLHDLDSRKSRLDWADAAGYQMAEIAFQVIDQVTLAMDFDGGADHAEIVARVTPFVAVQQPGRDPTEYPRVARWVLDNLINVGSVDRGFRTVYGTLAPGGEYQRRAFDFKLLIEVAAADGTVYLRASDEAVNVLVGALDTDVESAQIAAEIKLENLIARGRLSDAQAAAEQARYRTVQYAEQLRRKLEATRRDVRSVDWEHEVPVLIDEALTHIAQRYRAENAILATVVEARDSAEDPEHKRRAAELVGIVRDCVNRHTRLQARLQEAGATFRAEQDRQQFALIPARATIDLFGQVLLPVLELPLAAAAAATDRFFRESTGLAEVSAVRLADLVGLLLIPTPEHDDLTGAVPEPDLAPLPQPEAFTDEQWRSSDELLDLPGVARRLSGLLAEARILDPELAHLVALRALHAVGPEIGVARRHADRTVLVAVDDGAALADAEFGGADLLVGTASVGSAVAVGAAAVLPSVRTGDEGGEHG